MGFVPLRFHRHQSSPENNESDTWKAIKIKKEISKKGILNHDLFDRVLVSDYCQLVFFFVRSKLGLIYLVFPCGRGLGCDEAEGSAVVLSTQEIEEVAS